MSLLFFNFGAHWAILGRGSYAIRTRLRSRNTLFSFCMFSLSRHLKESRTCPFWAHFYQKIRFLCEKRCFKNCFKKGCPVRLKRPPINMAGGSLTAPLACAFFWTRNNYMSKKQQQLLISESISEPLSENGLFLNPFWKVFFFLLKSETTKDKQLQKCLYLLSLSKGLWSDTLWAKARRIQSLRILGATSGGSAIWTTWGAGPLREMKSLNNVHVQGFSIILAKHRWVGQQIQKRYPEIVGPQIVGPQSM